MDLHGENGSCNGDVDGENEISNGSSYNEGEGLEPKQSGNVNSIPSQWPLRHNNQNESLERQNSFSCNGFRQAKKPRYTYTGRISRIPSRYLDTDSDSGDGSMKKDGQCRLKVKRSRRSRKVPSSTGKFLVNGFKKHGEALVHSVADFDPVGITDNVEEVGQECVANVGYPDVFEDTSPISNDKISHLETPDKSTFHPNTSLSDELMCSAISQMECGRGLFEPTIVDDFCSKSKQTAKHSLTCSSCCVDILSKNNSRPRFESLLESNEEPTTVTCHENDLNNEHTLKSCSTTFVNKPCKRKNSNEASMDDTPIRQTVVSHKQISKHCQVSCATHNDRTGTLLERKSCENCREGFVKSSYVAANSSENIHNADFESSSQTTRDIRDIDSKLSKSNRLVKTTKKPSNKLLPKERSKDPEPFTLVHVSSKTEELDCTKDDLKMRKAFAKKVKQKQVRRNETCNQNDVLKQSRKNGVICKVKQKSAGKVNSGKVDKQTNKMKKKKVKKVTKIKETELTKQSQHSQDLDRVLGMRRSPNGIYEFLVEWHNGTSCWVSSDDIVTDKHNYYLREYLVETEQDVSVVNRVPFQAYCCDSLSLKECKTVVKSKKALRKMLGVETVQKIVCKPAIMPFKTKEDVLVEYKENYCYVTVNRETSKYRKTCLKILADLITAMEDAATSKCDVVVVQGLRSDVLCGLKLDDMSKTEVEEKENVMLSKARYLVQTLTNYPKLLIALISKSAEGIGAVFLSLFDMICDEDTWNRKQVLTPCAEESKDMKLYTLPRLTGHSLLSEKILMGRQSLAAEPCCPTSGCEDRITDSSSVASTLMEIETTLRLLQKETSLLQMSGKFTKLFPTTEPSFALFSDIKRDSFSSGEYDKGDNGQSFPENADDDHFLTVETPIDHEVDESNTATALSKDHSHSIKEQNNMDYASADHTINDQSTTEIENTEQSTIDDAINNQRITSDVNKYQNLTISTEHSITHQNKMGHFIGEQCNDTSTDQTKYPIIDHGKYISIDQNHPTSNRQSNSASIEQNNHTSIDQNSHTSIERRNSTSTDQNHHTSINESNSTSTDQCNHSNIDQSNHTSVGQTNHIITDQSSYGDAGSDHTIKDHTVADQSAINYATTDHSTMEQDDCEILNHTNGDQTLAACSATTGSSSIADSVLDNAIVDRTIDHDMRYHRVAKTSTTETTSKSMEVSYHEITKDTNAIETQLNHVSYMDVENSFNQAVSDRSFTARTTTDLRETVGTNLVRCSSNSSLNKSPMENGDLADCPVTQVNTFADCLMADIKENVTEDQNYLIPNVHVDTSNHVETDHSWTETMDSTTSHSTTKFDTSNQCTCEKNTFDKTDVTDQYIANSNINGRLNSTVQTCKDEISEKYASRETDDRNLMKGSTSPNRTENPTYNTNTSNDRNLTSEIESSGNDNNAEFHNCETTKREHNSNNEETLISSEEISEFRIVESYASNNSKQITTNNMDIDITNYPSTELNTECVDTVPHAMTDSTHNGTAEHASMNDNEIVPSTSSAVTAVDRYLEKLEAQIEEERRQAQQYIEEISRLWDNPFLSTNL